MKLDLDTSFKGIDGSVITASKGGRPITVGEIIQRAFKAGFRPSDQATTQRLYGLAQKGGRRRFSSRDVAALRAALGAYQTNALMGATLAARALTILDAG